MDVRRLDEMQAQGRSIFDTELAVAYYARVSTDKDEQINSLGNQKRYFEDYIAANHVDVAVLTVPKEAAIAVTKRLTDNGIDAIWNFTNLELTEPNSSTIVENIHFSDSLLSLSYFVSERRDENAAKAARAEKQ